MRYLVYIAVCLILITGCEKKQDILSQSADSPTTSDSNTSDLSTPVLVIDVRTAWEFSSWHIEGAINIPETAIEQEIENYAKDKNQKILLYCLSGARSGIALKILTDLGYTNVENIGSLEQAKARLE
jgi:rhodanese-related sulfurtransferase